PEGHWHGGALNAARGVHRGQRGRRRDHRKHGGVAGPPDGGNRDVRRSRHGVGGDGQRGRDLGGTDNRHASGRDPRVADHYDRARDEIAAPEGHWHGGALNAARGVHRGQRGRRRDHRKHGGVAGPPDGGNRDVRRSRHGVGGDGQ